MTLPKKYARMGFKKGWREYRKANKKGRIRHSSPKVKTMAKRKRRTYRKKSKQTSGLNLGGLAKPLTAIGYGFVRDKVSDMIAGSAIGQKLPVSQFTDEAAMLGALFISGKLGLNKVKYVRGIISNGKAVEWARIGQTLSDMQQQKATSMTVGTPTGTLMATVF